MRRTRSELNKTRGERLRAILSERGLKQCELAEKLGYSEQHISYMINGRRALTDQMADEIVKLFPPIRFEWLTCRDDFKTPLEAQLYPFVKGHLDSRQRNQAFQLLACLSGYDFVHHSHIEDGHPEWSGKSADDIDTLGDDEIALLFDEVALEREASDYYEIQKNGKPIAHCSIETMKMLEKEAADFIDYIIHKYALESKEGGE